MGLGLGLGPGLGLGLGVRVRVGLGVRVRQGSGEAGHLGGARREAGSAEHGVVPAQGVKRADVMG